MKIVLGSSTQNIQDLLQPICSALDYELFAYTEMTALEAHFEEENCDLICLGDYLADGTGFEFCRNLRRQEVWRNAPVLLLTKSATPVLVEKAFSAGFTETFQLDQLDALATLLRRFGEYKQPIKGKVLVVEDSLSQQKVVKSVLSKIGLSVTCCQDVAHAYAKFEQQDFDLVLTDVVLEGEQTGLDLIGRVRKLESAKGDIPIMVMSTYRSAAHRVEPFRIGANDYVSKPLEYDDLIARARRLIEARQLMNRVREQSKELKQNNIFMEQMLGRVSHECRNSINIGIGISKLMLRGGGLSERQEKQIDTILSAANHQLALVNDILDYTKLSSGNYELNEGFCEISLLLDEIVRLFHFQCEERGLELITYLDPALPENCWFDNHLVRQILINLLTNALKFTQEGQIEVTLNTVQQHDSESSPMLRIAVSDTGSGIAKDEQQLLFQAFKQTHTGRQTVGGTGLGLSICASFAHLMGGEMGVDSEVDKGSTFYVDLPLK